MITQLKGSNGSPIIEFANDHFISESPLIEYEIVINYDGFRMNMKHATELSNFGAQS